MAPLSRWEAKPRRRKVSTVHVNVSFYDRMDEGESVLIWFYCFFGGTYVYTYKPHTAISFIDSRPNST